MKSTLNHQTISKFFKNKNGKVVIFQPPNLPILAYFGFIVLSKIFDDGNLVELFQLLSYGALITWALMEIFLGDSYFRRILGLFVLIITVASRLN